MADFLLAVIVILLVFGVFRRYLLYFILGAVTRKLQRDMNRMRQHQQQQTNRPTGHTEVKYNSQKPGRRGDSRDDGEYVDYEEIKD